MSREPQVVLPSIYAFPPNRYTLGGTSYLIVRNSGNLLIDCPLWTDQTRLFLERMGGVSRIILTHRGGISPQLSEIYSTLKCSDPECSDPECSDPEYSDPEYSVSQCDILIQEQEAYLLAPLPVKTFQGSLDLGSGDRILWTPGYSPGASCVYSSMAQGILFTGRHLLPNAQGHPQPLKMPKTFHWHRQLRSVETLLQEFSSETLSYLLPGANIGLLRGKKLIADAYAQLQAIDLTR